MQDSRYSALVPNGSGALSGEGILLLLLGRICSIPQFSSGPIEGRGDKASLGRWITFVLLIEPVEGELVPSGINNIIGGIALHTCVEA